MPRRRGGTPAPEQNNVGQLTELLTTVLGRTTQRDRFSAPKYDGTGDVELFITQFDDVAEANRWSERDCLLHLRLSLEKDAKACSRGETVDDVYSNLRTRFGLTVRQARDRLAGLKREPNQSLHALGVEIQRLVELGYPRMGADDQMTLAVEAFKRAVDHRALNRHLLALDCRTIDDIVKASEEYFQVSGQVARPRQTIASLGRETEVPRSGTSDFTAEPGTSNALLERLVGALEQNSKVMAEFVACNQYRRSNPAPPKKKSNLGCHECGSTDHWKRSCPRLRQGNGNGSS